MRRLGLSLLAFLALAPLGRADTWIVVYNSSGGDGPKEEAKDALWALAERVKNPQHLRYVPYKKASHKTFFKIMQELKEKTTKDDVVIVYIHAHGQEVLGQLEVRTNKGGRQILSQEFFPILDALPCPTLVLVGACHSGAALQHQWKKTTVVCACRHDELAWSGGFGLALRQVVRQVRPWTIEELALSVMARTQTLSPGQHPVAFIGSTAKVRITK